MAENNKKNVTKKNEVKQEVFTREDLSNVIFYSDANEVNMIDSSDDYNYINMDESQIVKQELPGFDKEYNNIVDYIVKITRQIWKEKDIGLIYDTYSTGVLIHKGMVNSHGINEVISGTLQTLQAFPDRKGSGWNVIWSRDKEGGFYTSHRGRSVATNSGDSLYGPATGKKVMFRTSADCAIKSNKIYEEWLVMDTHHLVEQLGLDPVDFAKTLAKNTKKMTPKMNFGLPESAETGLPPKIYESTVNGFEISDFMLKMFNRIWERKSINFVKEFYEDNAVIHYVRNRDAIGHNEIQGLFLNLFASIPNGKLVLERITCVKRESNADWDVAVRWRIQGMHEGTGYFGLPSGKPIEIAGISHYQVRNEKIVDECLLFDGLDVLRQIHTSDEEVEGSSNEVEFGDGNFPGIS